MHGCGLSADFPHTMTHQALRRARKTTVAPGATRQSGLQGPHPKPALPARTSRALLLVAFTLLVISIYVGYQTLPRGATLQQSGDSWPYQVVDIPGKGKGAIATQDIQQGELILREKPLFLVPAQGFVRGSPGSIILDALEKLSPHSRGAFYNLSYVNLPEDAVPNTPLFDLQLALAIFETNAISAAEDGVGLFPSTARLNHGCSAAFNVVYNWRSSEGVLVVHALKPIARGEELLTTYLDTKRPRDSRRQILQAQYGFTCQCSVCSRSDDESKTSDDRLVKIAELYARFRTWQNGSISGQQAIDIARKIWALGEEEGYWSERGQLAADAAVVAAAHADVEATQRWARLAKKWYAIELGHDSEHAKAMDAVVADPKSLGYRLAVQMRAPESVGFPDV